MEQFVPFPVSGPSTRIGREAKSWNSGCRRISRDDSPLVVLRLSFDSKCEGAPEKDTVTNSDVGDFNHFGARRFRHYGYELCFLMDILPASATRSALGPALVPGNNAMLAGAEMCHHVAECQEALLLDRHERGQWEFVDIW
jgi:hypothetical protein